MSQTEPKRHTLFQGIKCLPRACPACRALFDDPATFNYWAVGDGKSFVVALVDSKHRNEKEYRIGDFIVCVKCGNKTFRMIIDERTVETVQEARLLVRDEGFTYWRESLGGGADLAKLLALIHASEEKEREQRRQALVEIGFE